MLKRSIAALVTASFTWALLGTVTSAVRTYNRAFILLSFDVISQSFLGFPNPGPRVAAVS